MRLKGTWTLTLAAVEPGNVAKIGIYEPELAYPHSVAHIVTQPITKISTLGILFEWPSGRKKMYFASNLLSATYTPATMDEDK